MWWKPFVIEWFRKRTINEHMRLIAPYINMEYCLIQARISNHMAGKVWVELFIHSKNVNGFTVDVWE